MLILVPILVLALVHCAPKSDSSTARQITSLSRISQHSVPAEVWGHAEDDRVTLPVALGSELRLGPLSPGESCELRAGLMVESGKLDSLQVRVSVEAGGTTLTAFDEAVSVDDRAWRAISVALPLAELRKKAGASAAEIDVILASSAEAEPHVRSEQPRIGWGTPYIDCSSPLATSPPPDRPHIVLISLDTLRADHLGVYGYSRPTSSTLDAFARDALVFDNAFTTSPWTLPAHGSLLTGLYPEQHGAGHASVYSPLDAEVTPIAERLSLAGYRTIAHVGGGYVGRAYGLDRGFDEWLDRHGASFESVLPEAMSVLSEIESTPTFLFLHTYGVHSPYKLPPGQPSFRTPASGPRQPDWLALAEMKLHLHVELERFHGIDDTIAAYDSSIRFVDRQLAPLFEMLEARGLMEHSLVIVTSDHGESFLERGNYISHGYTFFDEEVRVPLIVRLPEGLDSSRRSGRVADLIDLTDVAALILASAGVETSEALSGVDPIARLDGRAPAREMVRGESAYTGGLYGRTRDWKLIARVPERGSLGLERAQTLIPDFQPEEQIFRTRDDPSESVNLARESGELDAEVWRLRQKLGTLEAPGRGNARQDMLDRDQRRQLEALGYVDRISDPPLLPAETDAPPADTQSAPR